MYETHNCVHIVVRQMALITCFIECILFNQFLPKIQAFNLCSISNYGMKNLINIAIGYQKKKTTNYSILIGVKLYMVKLKI